MKSITVLYSLLAALSVSAAPAVQDASEVSHHSSQRRSHHHHHHTGEKKKTCNKKADNTITVVRSTETGGLNSSIVDRAPPLQIQTIGVTSTTAATPSVQTSTPDNTQPQQPPPPPPSQQEQQPAPKTQPDPETQPAHSNQPDNGVPGGKSGKATTTLYYDGSGGACGCFEKTSKIMFPWQAQTAGNFYTAAVNEYLYGDSPDDAHWCGTGCGKCYELTSTGSAACQNCGLGAAQGEKIVVMATNLCPPSGNYCAPRGTTNQFGFVAHFDIMAPLFKLEGTTWDNPVVDYKEITCPEPYATEYASCQCAK